MDIRELRIEDRVSHNGDIGEVVEIKTTHVGLMFKDDTSYLYNVNELEPIPLTDELLCKIGIIPYMRANLSTYYTIKDFCQLDYISNMGIYTFTAESGKQYIRTRKHINYLHQLQHELYDSGVEFKIEL
jgi:hypothetical protein